MSCKNWYGNHVYEEYMKKTYFNYVSDNHKLF